MIQPSFSFLVGVALPYSIRSRQRKGAQFPRMLAHTVWRSLLLIFLGIFLRSLYSSQTYFTFEDTLTQIGLGYTFLFLLAFRPATRAVDRVGRHPFRILAGVGAVSAARPGLQLRGGRRSRGLASSLHRLSRPLEQEQQPRPGLRCVVPEPVPARASVRVQRGRLPDAEFHPHAGHHDPGPVRRGMVPRLRRPGSPSAASSRRA